MFPDAARCAQVNILWVLAYFCMQPMCNKTQSAASWFAVYKQVSQWPICDNVSINIFV